VRVAVSPSNHQAGRFTEAGILAKIDIGYVKNLVNPYDNDSEYPELYTK